jgi:vacuolar-type H+-ATPase subunit H
VDTWDPLPLPTLPLPTLPAASPAGYHDARAWAEAEVSEWLAEADEEASAIIDRARAEALRCELAGHEELERLREEAVSVRMATAERVARRLNEARFEADQLLAGAAAQSEGMVTAARDVVRELLGGLGSLPDALPAGSGSDDEKKVLQAVASLEGLLAEGALAIPGRGGVLDLSGAVMLAPPVGPTAPPNSHPRVTSAGLQGRDEVVIDDTSPATGSPTPDGTSATTTLVRTQVRPVVDLRAVRSEPTVLLALPVRAGEDLRSVDDILPSRPPRGLAADWWDRLARLVRRAA